MEELEHEPDLAAPQLSTVAGRKRGEVTVLEQDAACVRLVEAAGQMQERRLARAAGPDERGELPGVETQIDAVEGDHFLSPPSEPLPDPLEPQQAHVSLLLCDWPETLCE